MNEIPPRVHTFLAGLTAAPAATAMVGDLWSAYRQSLTAAERRRVRRRAFLAALKSGGAIAVGHHGEQLLHIIETPCDFRAMRKGLEVLITMSREYWPAFLLIAHRGLKVTANGQSEHEYLYCSARRRPRFASHRALHID